MLLALLDKTADKQRVKNRHAGETVRAHHQFEAERIVSIFARVLALTDSRNKLKQLKKRFSEDRVCRTGETPDFDEQPVDY